MGARSEELWLQAGHMLSCPWNYYFSGMEKLKKCRKTENDVVRLDCASFSKTVKGNSTII